MYAVVESGGKQYKVTVGDKLKVEKLAAEAGDSINLDRVLMVADGAEITVGSPLTGNAVTAKVLAHGRGDKIKVFKMKRRKDYRRTQGHRQYFTEIEITGIGDAKAPASKKKTAKKADADKKPVAKKKAASKATAAKSDTKSTKAKSKGDDLTRINGIGPVIAKKLVAMGITTFGDIAGLDAARAEEINGQLNFKGRIEREEWVEQAKKLVEKSE